MDRPKTVDNARVWREYANHLEIEFHIQKRQIIKLERDIILLKTGKP